MTPYLRTVAIGLTAIGLAGCGGERVSNNPLRLDGSTAVADAGDSVSDAGQVLADAGPGDAGTPDAGAVTGIPVPPNQAAFDWEDREPNDTPQQAFPVGTIDFAMWMGFGAVPNAINNATDVDYYVFRTPDAAGLANILDVGFTIFWNEPVNLLDMRLYAVDQGTLGAVVAEAVSVSTTQEELMDGTTAPQVLQPNAVYLLEVRAGPGLSIAAPVSYNA